MPNCEFSPTLQVKSFKFSAHNHPIPWSTGLEIATDYYYARRSRTWVSWNAYQWAGYQFCGKFALVSFKFCIIVKAIRTFSRFVYADGNIWGHDTKMRRTLKAISIIWTNELESRETSWMRSLFGTRIQENRSCGLQPNHALQSTVHSTAKPGMAYITHQKAGRAAM